MGFGRRRGHGWWNGDHHARSETDLIYDCTSGSAAATRCIAAIEYAQRRIAVLDLNVRFDREMSHDGLERPASGPTAARKLLIQWSG